VSAAQPPPTPPPLPPEDFKNYFNYFTEIEEHFQRTRGTSLFMLSPVDWALIEVWKDSGVPLEAVLRGIDAAFEKWRAKKSRTHMVNSLAYCAQAVAAEAKAIAEGKPSPAQRTEAAPPFTENELENYLKKNAAGLRQAGFDEFAATLDRLAAELHADLEELEQRLTALEDKLLATLRSRQTEEELFNARRDLDLSLKPYRGKMTAEQLAMLERQYLDRRLLESANLPRLSLFYLH
jgi:hypothetical protein